MEFLGAGLSHIGAAGAPMLAAGPLLWLAAGALVGLSVGALPGLGTIAGLSLALAVLPGADPAAGLALMAGVVAVAPVADAVSRCGAPAGRPGPAVAAALLGGIVGTAALALALLAAGPLARALAGPELLLLTLLGLALAGGLAGRAPLKGLVAVGLGLSLGALGAAPAEGGPRLEVGLDYLQDGLSLVVVGLGLFAIPELVARLRGESTGPELRDPRPSLREAGTGVLRGAVPGLGDAAAERGAAPSPRAGEDGRRGPSAAAAEPGGALVPTLLLGIPGTGAAALFLGGIGLLGLEAGPAALGDRLPNPLTVVWALALAGLLGAGLCRLVAGPLGRLRGIRPALLAPLLLGAIALAATQSTGSLRDLAALGAFGLLGILMRRFEWPRTPLLIGVALADRTEILAREATEVALLKARTGGFDAALAYLATPLGIGAIAATALALGLAARPGRGHGAGVAEGGERRAPTVFAALLAAVPLAVLLDAVALGALSREVFPAAVGGLAFLAALLLLRRMRGRPAGDPLLADADRSGPAPAIGLGETLVWMAAFGALLALFGFAIALALFSLAWLRLRAGAEPGLSLALTAGGIAALLGLAWGLGAELPQGLLQAATPLPWPFGEG